MRGVRIPRCFTFLLLLCFTSPLLADDKKPNILWLIIEDVGPAFGCYGQKQVFTPNIDRLAAEGMKYTRFYCTAPVC